MGKDSTQETFTNALDRLVADIQQDKSVLAAILCGSLSHDKVWAKSDIDLALVTIDDKKTHSDAISLNADGVNVHAFLIPRGDFRRVVDGSLANSFIHSLLVKGRLLYSHDESIATMYAGMHEIGERDRRIQLLRAGTTALGSVYKAHKWFITRDDLDYTALWILYAATPLAQIEVMLAKRLVDREVIPQASSLNPELFKIIYSDMLNKKKTRASVKAALDAIDAYLADRRDEVFGLVVDHLREVGEARSCTEIDDHFARHYGVEHVTTACEYLADEGVITKSATAGRLTKRSNIDVQELAFFV